MYVCICNAVTDKQIRRAVADGAQSMRELRKQLGVCSDCGKCGPCAREILRDERLEQAALLNACPAA
ncbi:bacterioferritin-associated ferredoxin [Alkalilimnicola sp. S0819]|uniref:bacterioferritin-associated ferredoxin n=1 Tax=Alkalilimnicola sp. S0819 TaxID=2613922 RepID=UPI0012624759|nr:bacterioferritin-associated ferredoxin [Alkalilimnicola sp. S0819]KAB7623037.1 (2Fe-2S)-binding protein [Alkalilimnicola sp. S0819]MPQ17150.1 (2Fe-2S)-binding protein [Alkalilimnicola sp. S0819]